MRDCQHRNHILDPDGFQEDVGGEVDENSDGHHCDVGECDEDVEEGEEQEVEVRRATVLFVADEDGEDEGVEDDGDGRDGDSGDDAQPEAFRDFVVVRFRARVHFV